MTRKNMKLIVARVSAKQSKSIKKNEQLILETHDPHKKVIRKYLVEVKKVISDIPRCNGCGIRLDVRQSYKYATGKYCFDCYERRRQGITK